MRKVTATLMMTDEKETFLSMKEPEVLCRIHDELHNIREMMGEENCDVMETSKTKGYTKEEIVQAITIVEQQIFKNQMRCLQLIQKNTQAIIPIAEDITRISFLDLVELNIRKNNILKLMKVYKRCCACLDKKKEEGGNEE